MFWERKRSPKAPPTQTAVQESHLELSKGIRVAGEAKRVEGAARVQRLGGRACRGIGNHPEVSAIR